MTKKRLLSYRQLKAELKWVADSKQKYQRLKHMCQALMTHSSGLFFDFATSCHARMEGGSRRHGHG
jgi:hypothetical protein